jgi:hypothetical protein
VPRFGRWGASLNSGSVWAQPYAATQRSLGCDDTCDRLASMDTERAFDRDIVEAAKRLKSEINYNPTRFMQMVGELGGVAAASRLLEADNGADGFSTLWAARRLDLSVEAFALLPWYRDLFTDGQVECAARRLSSADFDVQAFLTSATRPAWY